MAAGVPDELYWRSTPVEVGALLDAMDERESRQERAAILRAGLVASAVYNVHRKKGKPAVKPQDFIRKQHKVQVVKPSELRAKLAAFADAHNARERAKEHA